MQHLFISRKTTSAMTHLGAITLVFSHPATRKSIWWKSRDHLQLQRLTGANINVAHTHYFHLCHSFIFNLSNLNNIHFSMETHIGFLCFKSEFKHAWCDVAHAWKFAFSHLGEKARSPVGGNWLNRRINIINCASCFWVGFCEISFWRDAQKIKTQKCQDSLLVRSSALRQSQLTYLPVVELNFVCIVFIYRDSEVTGALRCPLWLTLSVH